MMASKKVRRWFYTVLIALLLVLLSAMLVISHQQALELVYHPLPERAELDTDPQDFGFAYQNVSRESADGVELHAWYIPSQNGAAIILQHGYKSDRSELLEEAAMLATHGYGVLLSTVRAHDENEGALIGFGLNEMPDLDTWFEFLVAQPEISPEKIGMLGNSLGGSMVIQYAADNPRINAVVAHSAFSSMADTINTSIRYYTDLPAFPFADLIRFWAERELGGRIEDIDASLWIGQLSPRPVLILHSTTDIVISQESGELLFAAANEPKELWQVENVDHASFDQQLAQEFELRVVAFFDRYLLD